MLPENHLFLIRGEDGLEYGPVDLTELREWVQENRAGLGMEVRLDEPGSNWSTWQSYPELVALLAEVNATSSKLGVLGSVIAPLWRRAVAFLIDLILITILSTPILVTLAIIFLPDWFAQSVMVSSQGPFHQIPIPYNANLIASLIADFIMVLYWSGYHAAHGQTPAKTILRLRVVDQLGQKPKLSQSFLRSLVLVFSMSLFFIPLVYVFSNPERRTLHDMVAGTYVVEA